MNNIYDPLPHLIIHYTRDLAHARLNPPRECQRASCLAPPTTYISERNPAEHLSPSTCTHLCTPHALELIRQIIEDHATHPPSRMKTA